VLNDITNDVFKAIMIGFEPLIEETLHKIPLYLQIVERTPCVLDRPYNNRDPNNDDNSSSNSDEDSDDYSLRITQVLPQKQNDKQNPNYNNNDDILIPLLDSKQVIKKKEFADCDSDLEISMKYIQWLQALLEKGAIQNETVQGRW